MEFVMSKQTSSPFTEPSSDAHEQSHPAETRDRSPVSKCLRLKLSRGADGRRQSLDRDLVLRRIRHHRWANKVRDAVQAASLGLAGDGGDRCAIPGWSLEDAFSSP